MTPEEAQQHLQVIRQVVERARVERMAGAHIYVAWGAVIVVCIALTLGADAAGWPWGWVSFPLLGSLTGAWTAYEGRRAGLRRDTYGGRIEATLWFSAGTAIAVVLAGGLGSGTLPLEAVIPVISALTGAALCTSGTVFGQRLLTWSGVGFLLLVGPCFWLDWRTQYGLFGVAMLLGYVLPGVLLLRERDAG